jgi:hypothetical protein
VRIGNRPTHTGNNSPAPQSQERVVLRVHTLLPDLCESASVSFSAGTFNVALRCVQVLGPLPPDRNATLDVDLGHFAAGDYSVVAGNSNPGAPTVTNSFSVVERHVFAPPYAFPVVDYSDHWWNPQESGWGLTITQHPSDRLFAVWFVYSQSGQAVWYTLQPGTWVSSTVYSGPVYKTTGPYFGAVFDPSQVGVTQAGTATLQFADSNSGTFSYTVDGITGSKAIVRLPF